VTYTWPVNEGAANGPSSPRLGFRHDATQRAQRGRETVAEGGWAELPDELVEKVLEELQAAGHSEPQGPFGFSQATAKVRLVCSGWKAVHDALVKRLVLRLETTDEAVGMLARRFPAVVSLEFKGPAWGVLTDQGMLAVSNLHALTSLNLCCCPELMDEGARAVSNLPALTSLDLGSCVKVTDAGLRAVSNLHALTFLRISECYGVTDTGMQAVSNLPALTSLDLWGCEELTDAAVRAVSCLPALTKLDLGCLTPPDAGGAASTAQPPCAHFSQSQFLRVGGGAASSEQPSCAHRARPQVHQGHGPDTAGFAQPSYAHLPESPALQEHDGSWCASAPQHHRRA
jgi:hypothetical protein